METLCLPLPGSAAGGKALAVLEAAVLYRVAVVQTADDTVDVWQDNLSALGQLFPGPRPQVVVFAAGEAAARIGVVNALRAGEMPLVAIVPESARAAGTFSPGGLQAALTDVVVGAAFDAAALGDRLTGQGYRRVDFVEERGTFSRRGEVFDVWSPEQPLPLRIVLSYDAVESVRAFDVVTQRSGEFLRSAVLLPAADVPEVTLDRLVPPGAAWFDDRGGAVGDVPDRFDFVPLPAYAGNMALFAADVRRFGTGRLHIFCANGGDRERMEDILHEQGVGEHAAALLIGPLQDGFRSPARGLVCFSAQQVLYRRRAFSFPKFKGGRRLEGLWEIAAGDHVVHERYGIGRYLGLRKLVRGEQIAEYLCVEYRGGDKLYVPVDDFTVVQKYVGIEGFRPKLSSLDTASWERVMQKARDSARQLAAELLKLYAERQRAEGTPFGEDTPWERELADSFPYQETPDQLKAIDEVKADLMLPRPMERLICGDVGFGKTEVAIRAAFKVAQASRQVAVLVPTTVLAEQHFSTFSNRLAPFPVKVALLSRFQTPAEQRAVAADIAAGAVDIVVGTHRLLQKDVRFKDLGLLIIDEEHRFGVTQKERIKALKKNIDVLLMSATPIPRTLSLALSGMRDLSVIETPPYGRLPIETHLGPYDAETVRTIIRAELGRGGQVYYVHNRVETILAAAERLRKLLPDVRWGVIHGQLPAADIERVMWRFLHREIDVLIATAIIESGLDIPSVNTMIVEEAEDFGLAQLYQLRGRIGRDRRKAYCYLFYTRELLTEESRRRLESLQEFGELGSGFRLALRDLEIRGAGSILSARQHGFVRDVGFDLYSRLLEEAGGELRGAPPPREERPVCTIDLNVPAYLPETYLPAEEIRVVFYRRLAAAGDPAAVTAVREELTDRFGPLPPPAALLLRLTELKLSAAAHHVQAVTEDASGYVLALRPSADLSARKITGLAQRHRDVLEFLRDRPAVRLVRARLGADPLAALERFVIDL